MKGREHVYWALMAFSIFLFAFSSIFSWKQGDDYAPGKITWFALLSTIVVSIIFNELSNSISLMKKNEGNVDKNDKSAVNKRKLDNLVETICRIVTYALLGLTIIVCMYVGIKSTDHAYFAVFAYLVTAFGSIFPDFLDSTVPGDMRFHRDPWTHSTVIAGALVIGCLITVEYDYVSLNLLAIAFLIGNTAHLACDNFESGGTFIDIFKNRLHWKECPGDIRKIEEKYERAWLNSQVLFAAVILSFLILRYSMTSETDGPLDGFMAGIVIYFPATETPPAPAYFEFSMTSIIVLSTVLAGYVLTFISYHFWTRKPGKKKTSKKPRKVKASPAS